MRWSGFVRAPVAGGATWTFFVGLAQGGNGGDGVRGWVDGVAVVNAWGGVSGSEVSGTVVLSGASNSYYEVVVEYKAVGAAYGCSLSWSSSSVAKDIVLSSRVWYPFVEIGSSLVLVVPQIADPVVSTFSGMGLSIATVGVPSSFCIHLKDSFGNLVDHHATSVTAGEMSDDSKSISWISCNVGSCCIFSVFQASGSRFLHVMVNNVPAQISPINVIVNHGAIFFFLLFCLRWVSFIFLGYGCSTNSIMTGHGLTLATAGINAMVSVTILDSYGNSLPSSCQSAAMVFDIPHSRYIGSQALSCVQTSTAILAYHITRSGQYGIEVHGFFSKFNILILILFIHDDCFGFRSWNHF